VSNALFDPGREGILDRTIDMTAATVKVALVRGYTFSAAHKFLSDVTTAGGSVVGTAQALASKTYTSGVFDAADVTFTAVASGASVAALVIYNDTGTASTSRVIAYIDTATGLPVTPNGGDINVTWDNGANKIFKL
jgi:hypothetical protein